MTPDLIPTWVVLAMLITAFILFCIGWVLAAFYNHS